jgi:hypothetical protein
MIRIAAFVVCLWLAFSIPATAADSLDQVVIEEVVSVGVQPGPKMWRVSKEATEL